MKSGMILKSYDRDKHFILTRPAKISDITRGDMPYDTDYYWREKARLLQVRRWRKLKHIEDT